MAFTKYTIIADGGEANSFPISFTLPYLNKTDVQVRVNNEVDGGSNPSFRSLTWTTDALVLLGGADIVNNDSVVFTNTPDITAPQHDFKKNGAVTAFKLDSNQRQALLLVGMVLDGRFPDPFEDNLDMGSNRIINLADPIDPQDAMTLAHGLTLDGTQAAAEALQSAIDADISATAAGTSASEAAAQVTLLNEGLTATSSTSFTLGADAALNLTIETGKLYVPGHPIVISRSSDPSNFNQVATVVSYNSGSGAMVVDVDGAVEGTGTFSAWTIAVGGVQGPQGVQGTTGAAGAAGQITEKVYIAGTDYTKDSSTTLTLLAAVTSEEYIDIHMDTAYQDRNTYSLDGTTVTFDAPIPSDKVTITSHTSFGIGIPSDNTVTSAKIVDLAVATGDIANNAINAAKLATDAVETAKIKDIAVTGPKIANDAITGAKLAVSLVAGDVLFASGTDVLARLAKGSDTEVLTLASGLPAWVAPVALSTVVKNYSVDDTWTKPTGLVAIQVEMVGGGGGGGGGSTGGGASSGGRGGGGGYTRSYHLASALGSSEVVTVGDGGVRGAIDGNGGSGQPSSLGTVVTCPGGNGGIKGGNSETGADGTGGVPTDGDINVTGNGVNSFWGFQNADQLGTGGDQGSAGVVGVIGNAGYMLITELF